MPDDKIPQVILAPQVQEAIDNDPELATFLKGFKEAALNALQGVKDGRYPDFGAAMKAITGCETERVDVEIEIEAGGEEFSEDEN